MNLHLETRAIHAAVPTLNGFRPLSLPLYQTSTFRIHRPGCVRGSSHRS